MAALNRTRGTIIAVTLGTICIVSIIVIYFVLQKPEQQQPIVTKEVGIPKALTGPTAYPPPPPPEDMVFSYTGTILSIDRDQKTLVLTTAWGEKTVIIGSDTKIVQQVRPTAQERITMTQEHIVRQLAIERPYGGELNENDTITAISEADIKNQDSYTAFKIIVIK